MQQEIEQNSIMAKFTLCAIRETIIIIYIYIIIIIIMVGQAAA
jgi:hypothetical protein